MSYEFDPLNDNDSVNAPKEIILMEPGIYDFEVTKSTRKVSSKGNDMAQLQLKLTNNKQESFYLNDYLVFADNNFSKMKIKNFCLSVGLDEDYKKGSLSEDMSGLRGTAEIGIEPEKPKESGGFYPQCNKILDYLKTEKKVNTDFVNTDFIDDETIPF